MTWQCSIRLLSESGQPLSGYKVDILYSFFTGMDHDHTDSDGWVNFEIDTDNSEVYVKLAFVTLSVFPGMSTKTLIEEESVADGETFSFTISDDDF
jgi:hypothetical protein